ncbi:hypothetical protein SRB5_36570 [Streptomyces sp. RB5]|uniref:Uncharacterized protein n=1 Tax=Streptomyces smaragdinus TaxID=2585196 RepID=A0A7K0CJ46_9ACTN|nr:hypothetical protein [Streptomyces smaragdinus]MQY13509.1 hypothetical protein [Streptomyces smaragdinus]
MARPTARDTIKSCRREPGAGSREPGAFGLDDDSLLHAGEIVPSAIALSHQEQYDRLATSCPPALPRAVVVGDPCIDQLRAGLPFRETYRRAFGLLPGQRLVVVSSTWGGGSILGSPHADALHRTLAELPADEFRVFAAVHPNSFYGHGPWQIHSWLAPLLDHGLLLPPPDSGAWKAALCAADFLVGDHGSLTMYGAALGIPGLLGAFDESTVAPGSPMAALGRLLPRLSPTRPVPHQLAALAGQRDDPELRAIGETVTSEPGRCAELLRRLFYDWLKLDEPRHPASVPAVPVPEDAPYTRRLPHTPPMFVDVRPADDGEVTVRRYPAPLQRGHEPHLAAAHLAADRDDPDRRWPHSADVLLVPRGRTPTHPEDDPWSAFTAASTGCGLLAAETEDAGCLALLPDGTRLRVTWRERPAWASFPVAASAVYAWTLRNGTPRTARIPVRAGDLPDRGVLDLARS